MIAVESDSEESDIYNKSEDYSEKDAANGVNLAE